MSMLGKVDPKTAQSDTATVDLTKGSSMASRCAGFLFNKTTAVGAGIVAVGTVALNSIYSNAANNVSTVAKAVVETANPFLPTCPIDPTICGLMPDAIATVAEATGLSTAFKVSTAVAATLFIAGVAIMKMRPAATAPVKIDQQVQEPKAAEEPVVVNAAQVATAEFQADVAALVQDAAQQNGNGPVQFNEEPKDLVEPLEPTAAEIREMVGELFVLGRAERDARLADIPEAMRGVVINALRVVIFQQKVYSVAANINAAERAAQIAAIQNADTRARVAAEVDRILKL